MLPKVSILLPNLNNRPYLDERIRTIREQTLSDWELIVMDSYSDDGSWEYFQECAQRDERIRLYQSSERGIYRNFNSCVRLARGEYVYFATSDDTMAPNALEGMAAALDENPGCDLAHCKLRIIDEEGNLSTQKLWDNFFIVRYFGDLINQKHIRKAPHDGVLHFSGITVYTSLTQLLIRRSLFEKIGMFLTDIGSVADFEWGMRATLTADTVHVPEYLATWRLHAVQATSDDRLNIAKASGKFTKMADRAVKIARQVNPSAVKRLNIEKLKYILEKEKLYYEVKSSPSEFQKRWLFFKWFLVNRRLVFEFKRAKEENKNFVSQVDFLDYIKQMIKENDLEKNLMVI